MSIVLSAALAFVAGFLLSVLLYRLRHRPATAGRRAVVGEHFASVGGIRSDQLAAATITPDHLSTGER